MSGSTTQSISNVVTTSISLSPLAAALRNFGNCLIAGPTDIIDLTEAIRTYTSSTSVAADFGNTTPEYYAAVEWFSQVPQPTTLKVARWAKTATPGLLKGAVPTPAQQLLSNFTGIVSGSIAVTIDGTPRTGSAINLSGATTLPGVAALVQAALAAWATVTWDAVYQRFVIKSITTGTGSSVGYATASSLVTPMGLSQAAGASTPVTGSALETPVACATRLANAATDWYGFAFADSSLSTAQHQAVAAFLESASPSRLYGVSLTDSAILDGTSTTDLPYLLKASSYRRTLTQYTSNANPFAPIASVLAKALTVNYNGNNTALTLKFKTLPGVVGEYLSASQAAALEFKNCNVYVNYNNGVAILEQGVVANGTFIDEVVNLDWLQNAIQTDVFNLLYQSPTKIPQTDDGMHAIITTIENRLEGAVNNGVLAPGRWNTNGFGQLAQFDYLSKGYYVYAPPIATQAQTDRETRAAPLIQIAAKMAGAVHHSDILINVNR